jgi:hypothetical protein
MLEKGVRLDQLNYFNLYYNEIPVILSKIQ